MVSSKTIENVNGLFKSIESFNGLFKIIKFVNCLFKIIEIFNIFYRKFGLGTYFLKNWIPIGPPFIALRLLKEFGLVVLSPVSQKYIWSRVEFTHFL